MHPLLRRPLLAGALLSSLCLCACNGQSAQHLEQSLSRAGAAAKAEGALVENKAEDLSAYIGDKFADAEAALARKRVEDTAAPSF